MTNMGDAFVDGHAATQSKEDYGHDQGPKVEFLTITKGMRVVGRFGASMNSQQKQRLIPRICERVDPFRHHRGTAGI